MVHLEGDKPGMLDFTASLGSVHPTAKVAQVDENTVKMTGQIPGFCRSKRSIRETEGMGDQSKYPEVFGPDGKPKPGVELVPIWGRDRTARECSSRPAWRSRPTAGTVRVEGDKIKVTGATRPRCDSPPAPAYNGSFKSPSREGLDPAVRAEQGHDRAALSIPYSQLVKRHIEDYQKLFNRVSLTLAWRPGPGERRHRSSHRGIRHGGRSGPGRALLPVRPLSVDQLARARAGSRSTCRACGTTR